MTVPSCSATQSCPSKRPSPSAVCSRVRNAATPAESRSSSSRAASWMRANVSQSLLSYSRISTRTWCRGGRDHAAELPNVSGLLAGRDVGINISALTDGSAPKEIIVIRTLGAAGLLVAGLLAVPAGPAAADEVEQVVNGGFTAGTDPWWSTAGMPITLRDGKACVDVPGGTTNRWDAAVGQN